MINMRTLFKSSGILKYSIRNNFPTLVLEIDKDIAKYYRSLLPKSISFNIPKYPPHITLVREGKDIPNNMGYWNKYEGEEIEFYYENEIKFGTIYIWLDCFSKRLEEIRNELGLSIKEEFTVPPECFIKTFHSTLANIK